MTEGMTYFINQNYKGRIEKMREEEDLVGKVKAKT